MTLTGVETPTAEVVIVKVAVVPPTGTVTVAGTVATVEFSLASATTAPPPGAAALRVTVPVEEDPPVRIVGFADTAEIVGGFTVNVVL